MLNLTPDQRALGRANANEVIGSPRRDFLSRAGLGFGVVALAGLLDQQGLLAETDSNESKIENPKSKIDETRAPRDPALRPHAGPIRLRRNKSIGFVPHFLPRCQAPVCFRNSLDGCIR